MKYNYLQNFINQTKHNTAGFTLIELLVVSGIMVAVSSIIAGILFSTLRGANTSTQNTAVAQNGNYALSLLSDTVKRAKRVTAMGGEPITSCVTPVANAEMEIEMLDGGRIRLVCDDATRSISSQSAVLDQPFDLINTQEVQLVAGSCAFSCSQENEFTTPAIKIQFELGKYDGEDVLIPESQSSFETLINIRNFPK